MKYNIVFLFHIYIVTKIIRATYNDKNGQIDSISTKRNILLI